MERLEFQSFAASYEGLQEAQDLGDQQFVGEMEGYYRDMSNSGNHAGSDGNSMDVDSRPGNLARTAPQSMTGHYEQEGAGDMATGLHESSGALAADQGPMPPVPQAAVEPSQDRQVYLHQQYGMVLQQQHMLLLQFQQLESYKQQLLRLQKLAQGNASATPPDMPLQPEGGLPVLFPPMSLADAAKPPNESGQQRNGPVSNFSPSLPANMPAVQNTLLKLDGMPFADVLMGQQSIQQHQQQQQQLQVQQQAQQIQQQMQMQMQQQQQQMQRQMQQQQQQQQQQQMQQEQLKQHTQQQQMLQQEQAKQQQQQQLLPPLAFMSGAGLQMGGAMQPPGRPAMAGPWQAAFGMAGPVQLGPDLAQLQAMMADPSLSFPGMPPGMHDALLPQPLLAPLGGPAMHGIMAGPAMQGMLGMVAEAPSPSCFTLGSALVDRGPAAAASKEIAQDSWRQQGSSGVRAGSHSGAAHHSQERAGTHGTTCGAPHASLSTNDGSNPGSSSMDFMQTHAQDSVQEQGLAPRNSRQHKQQAAQASCQNAAQQAVDQSSPLGHWPKTTLKSKQSLPLSGAKEGAGAAGAATGAGAAGTSAGAGTGLAQQAAEMHVVLKLQGQIHQLDPTTKARLKDVMYNAAHAAATEAVGTTTSKLSPHFGNQQSAVQKIMREAMTEGSHIINPRA